VTADSARVADHFPAEDTYVDGNGNIMELTSTYEVTDGISTHTETIYWKLQRSE
jgi:hypothetical protein